ncbi:MAG: hypothetical protein R3F30_01625 [Planctomycetota bacterium]
MARLPSNPVARRSSRTLVLAGLVASALLSACEAPRPDSFVVDPVLYPAPDEEIRDVLVWPVIVVGESPLDGTMRDLLATRIYEGMINHRFSALAPSLVQQLSKEFGVTEAGASKAVGAADADGVLVLTMSDWDEAGLYALGKVRTRGEIKILNKAGKVRWIGRFTVDSTLVPGESGNASLEEKRRQAVEAFARRLSRWLPDRL